MKGVKMDNIDVELMQKIDEIKRQFRRITNDFEEQIKLIKNARLVGSPKVIQKIKINKRIDKAEEIVKEMNESISGFKDLEKYQKKYFIQLREKVKKL